MERRSFVLAALAAGMLPTASVALTSRIGKIRIELMADGLDVPWSLGFLPDDTQLVTDREGLLYHLSAGRLTRVAGVPEVQAVGQGGLLDVLVPRRFAQDRTVWLSFSAGRRGGIATALGRGRLSADSRRLDGFETVWTGTPSGGGRHFGGRLAEGPDGMIYLSVGDRGDDDSAQDLTRSNGAILRFGPDGRVPRDNPLAGQAGGAPEIWSWGHRNPQGLAFDAQGRLWAHEHGARGGDEINLVRRGLNYGWPVISYGRQYSGLKIGEGTAKPGMEQPAFYWDPSIAPSGFVICSGRMFPDWRGHMLVGSLKFDMISRLSGTPLREIERIEGPETARVRDLREAPDGAIWMISENNGAIYRLTPG